MASHGSDTPTSPRAVLHHKDTILCTFMHTTVIGLPKKQFQRDLVLMKTYDMIRIFFRMNFWQTIVIAIIISLTGCPGSRTL